MTTATQLTANESAVLAALRSHRESGFTDRQGLKWSQVYLDSASADLPSMSPRTFASVLGSLAKKGFYSPQGDDCFGDVLDA